jgi:hypothetical protein
MDNHPKVVVMPVREEAKEKENAAELGDVLPYIQHVHIFHWENGVRFPLSKGSELWVNRMRMVRATKPECAFLLEFVKDDSLENFYQDAEALKSFIAQAQAI